MGGCCFVLRLGSSHMDISEGKEGKFGLFLGMSLMNLFLSCYLFICLLSIVL